MDHARNIKIWKNALQNNPETKFGGNEKSWAECVVDQFKQMGGQLPRGANPVEQFREMRRIVDFIEGAMNVVANLVSDKEPEDVEVKIEKPEIEPEPINVDKLIMDGNENNVELSDKTEIQPEPTEKEPKSKPKVDKLEEKQTEEPEKDPEIEKPKPKPFIDPVKKEAVVDAIKRAKNKPKKTSRKAGDGSKKNTGFVSKKRLFGRKK